MMTAGRWQRVWDRIRHGPARLRNADQVMLLVLAVGLGVASGYAALGFRLLIELIDDLLLDTGRAGTLLLADIPWWQRLLVPAAGGLVIGIAIRYLTRDRRPEGVADVIEVYTRGSYRLSLRSGLTQALISASSIGVGASVGREGPVVHIGAAVANWLGGRVRLRRDLVRVLIGCGVAAAVAASFNAPIAGVFFALEVVIGHYALTAFAPIVIASVAGTMISRAHFGDFPAFIVPAHELVSLWEFPAFALLGAGGALVAIAFVRATALVQTAANLTGLPTTFRPAVAGLLTGLIALAAPQVLGVGYPSTDAALNAALPIGMLLTLLVAKFAATAICLGCGFGGGVFSPSLFMGAMFGGAFGLTAATVFPDLASSHSVYAMVGMGALAGAVLGAPISTILMVFELTGDYPLTVALMIATVVASVVMREARGESFFTSQLRRRGRDVAVDRAALILDGRTVGEIVRANPSTIAATALFDEVRERLPFAGEGEFQVVDEDGQWHGVITVQTVQDLLNDGPDDTHDLTAADIARADRPVLARGDSLETARAHLDASEAVRLPVVETVESKRFVGVLDARDVLRAVHRALGDASRAT